MATPGLTWPRLSACVQGERYLVNPTPERLLHGAGAGSALGRLRQSCPCSLARFSLSTDTLRGISPLGFFTIKSTDRVRLSSWETQSGLRGAPAPWMGRERKGAQMGQMLLTSRRTHCQ